MILKKNIKENNCPEGYIVGKNGKCIAAMTTAKKYSGQIIEKKVGDKIFRKRKQLSKPVTGGGKGTTFPIGSNGFDSRDRKRKIFYKNEVVDANYTYNLKNKRWLDVLLKKVKSDFPKNRNLDKIIFLLKSLKQYNYKNTKNLNSWVVYNNNIDSFNCTSAFGGNARHQIIPIGIVGHYCLDFDIQDNGLMNLNMKVWS